MNAVELYGNYIASLPGCKSHELLEMADSVAIFYFPTVDKRPSRLVPSLLTARYLSYSTVAHKASPRNALSPPLFKGACTNLNPDLQP
jgi:hypothetical protein